MKTKFSTCLLTVFTLNAITSAIAYGFEPTLENIKDFDRLKNKDDTSNNWQSWDIKVPSENSPQTFNFTTPTVYGYDYKRDQPSDTPKGGVITIQVPTPIQDNLSASFNMKPTITFSGEPLYIVSRPIQDKEYNNLFQNKLDEKSSNFFSGLEIIPNRCSSTAEVENKECSGQVIFNNQLVIDQISDKNITNKHLSDGSNYPERQIGYYSIQFHNAGILIFEENNIDPEKPLTTITNTFNKPVYIRTILENNFENEPIKGEAYPYNYNFNGGIAVYENIINNNTDKNDPTKTNTTRYNTNSTFANTVSIESISNSKNMRAFGVGFVGHSLKEGSNTITFKDSLKIVAKNEKGRSMGFYYYSSKPNDSKDSFKPKHKSIIDTISIDNENEVTLDLSANETYGFKYDVSSNQTVIVSKAPINLRSTVKSGSTVERAYFGNFELVAAASTELTFEKPIVFQSTAKCMLGLNFRTDDNSTLNATFKDHFSMEHEPIDNTSESTLIHTNSSSGSIRVKFENGVTNHAIVKNIHLEGGNFGKSIVEIEGRTQPIELPVSRISDEYNAIYVNWANSSLVINKNETAPLLLYVENKNEQNPLLSPYKLKTDGQGKLELHIANHPNKLGILHSITENEGTNIIVVTGDANKSIGDSTKADIMFSSTVDLNRDEYKNPGINSLTVKDNGLVRVLPETADSDSSTIQNVNLTNGGAISLIDLPKTEAMTVNIKTKSLTIDHLSGTGGHFILDIDASNNTDNDKLYINQFDAGTHYLDLNNTASTSDKAANSVLAYVNVHTADSLFKATEGKNTLYYRRYELASRETQQKGYTQEWYLKKAMNVSPDEEATPTLQTLKGINSYALYSLSTLNDTLHQRLGLQSEAIDAKNLWIRASYHHGQGQPQDPFKANLERYQVGLNVYKHRGQHYSSFFGLSYDRLIGQVDLPASSTRNHMDMLGLYHTYHNDRGIYLDTIVQYGWNKFQAQSIKDEDNILDLGARSNHLFNASLEVGKHIDKNLWFFEPQVQLSYSRASAMHTRLVGPEGTFEVNTHSMNYWLARAGLLTGRYFDKNHKSQIYAKINVLHQLQAKTHLHILGNDDLNMDYGRNYHNTWIRLGLGANYHADNHTTLYGDIEKSVGGSPWSDLQINIGLRHQF